uniref:PBPb domain-containing protein n=1 Tax=Macrostomum lignano TaxID=282301 RepID=A0A1I8HVY1_9PLAT
MPKNQLARALAYFVMMSAEFRVKWLLSAALCLLAAATVVVASQDSRPDSSTVFIDATSPNIPWAFVPIGPENVTALVLEDDKSAWVLFFHEGWLFEPFREAAEQLRGLIRFGLVHRDDRETAELLNLNTTAGLKFRALPFGPAERKLATCLDTDSFDAAVSHASDSVPSDSIVRVTEKADIQRLLTEAHANSAAARPGGEAVQRVQLRPAGPGEGGRAAGLVRPARLLQPGAGAPGAAAAAGAGADGLATVEISRLDESGIVREDKDGELTYAESLRFLVEYNRNFRAELLGENRADDSEMRLLSGLLRRERLAFGIVDLSARPAPTPDSSSSSRQDSMKSNNEEL